MGPKKGPSYPVNTEWQEAVRSRMRELGIDQYRLAEMVQCKQPSISALLSPAAKHSTLVPAIHEALAWPPPSIFVPSRDHAEIARLVADMPDDVKEAFLAQARAIMKRIK